MFPNIKGSEELSILASIDPVSQAAGTVATGWVAVANFHGFLALIETGALGASATLDAKFQQAQDATGTGVKDVAGKAIMQLTQAASGSNRQVLINLRPEDVDNANAFTFVRLSLTVAVAASVVGAQILGVHPRYVPADAYNQAAVAQIV